MRQTVVGVFDRHATARQAAQQLRDSGFGDSVWVTEAIDDDRAPGAAGSAPREEEGVMAHVRHFIAELFGQDDSRRRGVGPYVEAVRRGGAVVRVEVDGEPQADAARAALQAAGAVDIAEAAALRRAAGWQGDAADGSDRARAMDDPIGRATPGLGGATLPPEMAEADRLAAGDAINRPPASADHSMTDTLRNADVDDESPGRGGPPGEPLDYRTHFEAHYAQDGCCWEDYEPAYRYGYQMRADHRYLGRDWAQVEPELREAWELRDAGPWDRFKAAVRQGWERMTA